MKSNEKTVKGNWVQNLTQHLAQYLRKKLTQDLTPKEAATRAVNWVKFVTFWSLFILIMPAWVSFISRRCIIWMLKNDPYSFILLGILSLVVLAGMIILHFIVFPKVLPEYPVEDWGDAWNFCIKKYWVHGVIAFVAVFIGVIVIEFFWPVETAPNKLPAPIFRAQEEDALLAGDFGEIAHWNSEEKCWFVCTGVEIYGPFEYGGDTAEMVWTSVTLEEVSWNEAEPVYSSRAVNDLVSMKFNFGVGWDAPESPYSSHIVHDITAVKFNHYDDGTWMIVKHFKNGGTKVPAASPDDILASMIQLVQEIPYRKHDAYSVSWRGNMTVDLTEATNGVLVWEQIDHKMVWNMKAEE